MYWKGTGFPSTSCWREKASGSESLARPLKQRGKSHRDCTHPPTHTSTITTECTHTSLIPSPHPPSVSDGGWGPCTHPSRRRCMCSHSIPPCTVNLRRLQAWLFSYLPNWILHTMAGWSSRRVRYCQRRGCGEEGRGKGEGEGGGGYQHVRTCRSHELYTIHHGMAKEGGGGANMQEHMHALMQGHTHGE